jgi:hypothetical protein
MQPSCTCGRCEACQVKEQLVKWGKERGWPVLPVGPSWSIAAGKQHWEKYLETHDEGDLRLAWGRRDRGGCCSS